MAKLADKLGMMPSERRLYTLQNMPSHLARAGQQDRLKEVLTTFDFLQAKVNTLEPQSLIEDYEHDNTGGLRLIQGALRLSAHVLIRDRHQLATQLLARLQSLQLEEIQTLLKGAGIGQQGPWLRPLTSSLTSPQGPLLRTYEGHKSHVSAVAVTPDGQRVVSASASTIQVWHISEGQASDILKVPRGAVNHIVITPDGRYAICAVQKALVVWDLNTKRHTLIHLRGEVTALVVTPDGQRIVAASGYGLGLWDLGSGEALSRLYGHNGAIKAVVVTPDGRRVVSASEDKTLRMWDLHTGEELYTFHGHDDVVTAVDVTPDGRFIISASRDHTLRVWDAQDGHERHILQGHSKWVTAVAVIPDNQRAISASGDGTLVIWDIIQGRAWRTLRGHQAIVHLVKVAADGKQALSASYGHDLIAWDLETGVARHTMWGHAIGITAIEITLDGRRAISASRDRTLKVWDISALVDAEPENAPHPRGWQHLRARAIAVTPDGRLAISAVQDNALAIWDVENGQGLYVLRGHTGPVTDVVVTPDGRWAISASVDQTLKVWDLDQVRERYSLRGHSDRINVVISTPDSKRAISASSDTTLKIWDLDHGKALHTLPGHSDAVCALAVASDMRRLVSATQKNDARVWDLGSGEQLCTLSGWSGSVYALFIQPNERRIMCATSSEEAFWDKTIKVWALEEGVKISNLPGHPFVRYREDGTPSYTVTVAPDGRHAISIADGDTRLIVWDIESGREVLSFDGEWPMEACAISADGRTIIAGDHAGRMHFLRIEGMACRAPGEMERRHKRQRPQLVSLSQMTRVDRSENGLSEISFRERINRLLPILVLLAVSISVVWLISALLGQQWCFALYIGCVAGNLAFGVLTAIVAIFRQHGRRS